MESYADALRDVTEMLDKDFYKSLTFAIPKLRYS